MTRREFDLGAVDLVADIAFANVGMNRSIEEWPTSTRPLPAGWLEVSRIVRRGDDKDDVWFAGPILSETEEEWVLLIEGTPYPFSRDLWIGVRGLA